MQTSISSDDDLVRAWLIKWYAMPVSTEYSAEFLADALAPELRDWGNLPLVDRVKITEKHLDDLVRDGYLDCVRRKTRDSFVDDYEVGRIPQRRKTFYHRRVVKGVILDFPDSFR